MDELNLKEDSERARRYKIIGDYLYEKDYLQPKVPDLDDIVPLPPAKITGMGMAKLLFSVGLKGTRQLNQMRLLYAVWHGKLG